MDEPDDGSDSGRDDPVDSVDRDESDADSPADEAAGGADASPEDAGRAPEDVEGLREELRELRDDLGDFEASVEDRTVHRSEVEAELKRYVRKRLRRGHARGWGPYLVLLYGTAMTLGAFYMLSSGWAIAAMFVIWLSTLGLYVLMIMVGVMISLLSTPGKVIDLVRKLR